MHSSSPLITIITPTYNAGKLIGKCIESVQSQSFKNFEHLILDGQSTDDTVNLVKQFQQKYSTIKLTIEKDKGVFDAMNKGIKLARANWLYFLGADDYFYNNDVLENISAYLLKNETQIVYGNVFFQNLHRLYDKDFDIEKILKHNICHQAVFYHAIVFKIIGDYDLNYRTEADYDLNLKCWLTGKISHLYVPLTIAYYADGGISSMQNDEQLIKEYPDKTIHAVLTGKWNIFLKVHLLSKIYRKILQRRVYSSGIFIAQLFKGDFFLYRFFAFLWMCLSSPFYLLKGKDKTKLIIWGM
jgi:glycosyltransferase involved in cell wall biosynthesis